MTPIEFRVTEEQLFALGGKMGSLGKLSPLRPRTSEQEKMAGSMIVSPTLLSSSGEIRAEYLPALQILASPTAYVYLTYIGRAINLECSLYYQNLDDSGPEISLTIEGENLVVNSPSLVVQVHEILRQYIGETLIRPLDYQLSLSLPDAWVMFAVLDASRKQLLEAHLKYQTPEIIELSRKQVEQAVKTESQSLQWLAPYFAQCLSLAKISASDIKISIENLSQAGLLEISGDSILPGEVLQSLALEYLVTDGLFRLRSEVLRDGELLTTDLRAVQGRSNAIMLWSFDQSSIDLFGLSPAEFMLAVHGLTQNPSLQMDNGSPAPPHETSSAPPPPESL